MTDWHTPAWVDRIRRDREPPVVLELLPLPDVHVPAGVCPLCGQPVSKHKRLAASCLQLQRAHMHQLDRTLGTPRALRRPKPRTSEPRPRPAKIVRVTVPKGVEIQVDD